MKKNMGNLDRTLRVMVAIVIAILYFTGTISGTLAIILGVVSVAFILTSMVGTCPVYLPFGLSTVKNDRSD
ncbi:YgaP family membrane protein [Rhodohalobacter mucosus]|uniref:DUF2892 domain-containing protein n=1 Tax=Rhodohalobacter mucosus TaxID=2079485 RepID=A0A316TTD3_9BACT|nr:DUF2892 domain-containing protein [Rhodohalobacter mucosus]PWN07857.1 DUF2892 domain-containing protein [Rhodohalobacter mucosus]